MKYPHNYYIDPIDLTWKHLYSDLLYITDEKSNLTGHVECFTDIRGYYNWEIIFQNTSTIVASGVTSTLTVAQETVEAILDAQRPTE